MMILRPQTRLVCKFCEGYAHVKVLDMAADQRTVLKTYVRKCPKNCWNGFEN